jgi:hypothetical protein
MKFSLPVLLSASLVLISGCQPLAPSPSSLTTDSQRADSVEQAETEVMMAEVATIAAASATAGETEASEKEVSEPPAISVEDGINAGAPSPVAADKETIVALEPGAAPASSDGQASGGERPAGEKPTSDANPTTRPKADRTPRKAGDPIRITFDNLIVGMQADIVFRPWMLKEDVKELEGQRVSITGVMHGAQATKKTDYFVLLRNKECKYGPGGQADHLAEVNLKAPNKIAFTTATVRVEGTLRIEPKTGDDGNTWSLYILDDAKVTVQ